MKAGKSLPRGKRVLVCSTAAYLLIWYYDVLLYADGPISVEVHSCVHNVQGVRDLLVQALEQLFTHYLHIACKEAMRPLAEQAHRYSAVSRVNASSLPVLGMNSMHRPHCTEVIQVECDFASLPLWQSQMVPCLLSPMISQSTSLVHTCTQV